MTAKTPFSSEELSTILDDYDLGDYQTHAAFERGSDQTNILLTTTVGKFSFRYYEKRTEDYVLFEVDLLHYLSKHTYPCPMPIRNKHGRFVGQYQGRPFALFSFLEGEHNDDHQKFSQIAQSIGKLHAVTIGYKPPHSAVRPGYDPAYCWRFAQENAAKINSAQEAQSRLAWLKAELDHLRLPQNMPKGVVHGDTNPSNFLYLSGRLSAVLDFDQAAYTYLLYDIANMIYWWAWPDRGDLNFDQAKALITAYETVRHLTEDEKRQLFTMLKLCICVGIGWFIHAKDFPNNQRKIEQLNSLGEEACYVKLFV